MWLIMISIYAIMGVHIRHYNNTEKAIFYLLGVLGWIAIISYNVITKSPTTIVLSSIYLSTFYASMVIKK